MKGNIIGFDPIANSGAISGHDGQRYDFVTLDWHSDCRPSRGDVVDFRPEGQRALQVYVIDPEYVEPSTTTFLFAFEGRISRRQYWLKWALPVIVVGFVLGLIQGVTVEDPKVRGAIIGIFDLVLLWPSIAIGVKRAHDRNRSGWFLLVFLVPLLNFWPLIELLFVRGTIGGNRFGADPTHAH